MSDLPNELLSKIYLYDFTFRMNFKNCIKELNLYFQQKLFKYFYYIVLSEFKYKVKNYQFHGDSIFVYYYIRKGARYLNFNNRMFPWIHHDWNKIQKIYSSYEKYLLECFQLNIEILNKMFHEDLENSYVLIRRLML